MAGELTPRFPLTIPDDPEFTAAGAFTPSRHNLGVKLTGGTNNQILTRSTADDGTTGMALTSTPTVSMIIYPLNTDPLTLSVGGMTVVDDTASLTLYIKRLNGDLVSLVIA